MDPRARAGPTSSALAAECPCPGPGQGRPDRRGRRARGRARRRRGRRLQPRRPPARLRSRRPPTPCRRSSRPSPAAPRCWSTAASAAASTSRSRWPSAPTRSWSGGRALWGLAAGGEDGAERVLELLRDELELALALCGCASPAQLEPRPRAPRHRPRPYIRSSDPFHQPLDGPAHPQRRIAEPRPRRRGAVLGGLRQRRLLDLLRARRHRRLRPRPDPDRLRHLRPDLRRHRRHLRRGDRDVPGGRRLLELRPPRLQRAGQLHRRLGADAQLHDHGRDLGLLRAPLPGRLLGPGWATAPATSSAARS